MNSQKGFTLKSTVIIVAIILALAAGAYYLQKPKMEQRLSPKEVTEAFYSHYIESADSLAERRYRESDRLTENFITKIEESMDSYESEGHDPFVCSQDIPQEFETRIIDSSEEMATVSVETSFENHNFIVNLIFSGEKWLIDDIICQSENYFITSEETDNEVLDQEDDKSQEEDSEIINNDPYKDIDPQAKSSVERAVNDLSQRLMMSPADIKIGDVVPVIFSDHSLGTSQPGEIYPQAPVSGYVIILSVRSVNYRYHASESQIILINQ